MERHIELMIVDDHQMFREGLKFLLQEVPGTNLMGEAENGKQGLDLAKSGEYDIIFCDIKMPEIFIIPIIGSI